MTNINRLLNKYETPYGENRRVKNEQTSNDYWNEERQNAKLKDRQLLLDNILNETNHPINIQQKQEIKNWIELFKDDWKNIHRQSKDETILLALIIIQYNENHYYFPKILEKACTKYELNWQRFTTIQNRIIFLIMKNTPLKYTLSEKYRQYQKT